MYEQAQTAQGLGCAGLAPETACSEPPCSSALMRMEKETARLGDAVERLTSRLSNVLRPVNGIEKERTRPVAESPLHSALIGQCERISAIATKIEETLGNLTV